MLFNIIVNKEPSVRLIRLLIKEEPSLKRSFNKKKDDWSVKLLTDIREELEEEVLPAIDDRMDLGVLEFWLDEQLKPGLRFDVKHAPHVIRFEPNPFKSPSNLEEALRESIALEIYDFCSKKGLSGFQQCRYCSGWFMYERRSDTKYCSQACRKNYYKTGGKKTIKRRHR